MQRNAIYIGGDLPNYVERALKNRYQASPDLQELRQTNEHLVFVYGTLMDGYANNYLLNKSKYLGRGRTLWDKYIMYSARQFPVVAQVGPEEGEFIYGEVYAVNADTIMNLDFLENNGTMYVREEIRVKLQDQPVEEGTKAFRIEKCWCYFGDDNYWDYKAMPKIPLTYMKNNLNEAGFKWSYPEKGYN